jgi:hypothetical protein
MGCPHPQIDLNCPQPKAIQLPTLHITLRKHKTHSCQYAHAQCHPSASSHTQIHLSNLDPLFSLHASVATLDDATMAHGSQLLAPKAHPHASTIASANLASCLPARPTWWATGPGFTLSSTAHRRAHPHRCVALRRACLPASTYVVATPYFKPRVLPAPNGT